MRKIEDLLSFKINLEVGHELECQILFDNRKDKVEEEALLDEYDDSIETVSWESIEIACWDLMKTKGMNWKLFSIWLESLIYIDGWNEVLYCFQALEAVLKNKIEILLGQEDKVNCLEFMDKSLSRAMLLQPIKEEDGLFQYFGYKKTNPQKLYDILATFDIDLYEDLLNTHDKCMKILADFPLFTKEVYIHYARILDVFEKLKDILLSYAENFIEEEEEEEVLKDNGKEEIEKVKFRDKEQAFQLIADAFDLLVEVDSQNISIPLLRKILRWKDYNMSEILNEVNDKESAYYLLKFLID